MPNQDHTDRISQYLDQEMSPAERQEFEQDLQQNPELAATFEIQRHIYLAVWQQGQELQRAELQKLGDELLEEYELADKESSAPTRPLYRQPWAIVALVASIVILLVVFLNRPSPTYEELGPQLFAEHFPGENDREQVLLDLPQTFEENTRGNQAAPPDTVQARIEAYIAANPSQTDGFFYLGAFHFQNENYVTAIEAFDQVPPTQSTGELAQWFKALALLQNAQIPEAKRVLSDIAQQPDHKRQKEAQEILHRLD